MRLHIEKLGPLREVDVDLSHDLIVLTGPNNAGKTWFAWTVYALMRGSSRISLPVTDDLRLTLEKNTLTLSQEQCEALSEKLIEATVAKVTRDLADVFASSRAFFASTKLRWSVPPRKKAGSSAKRNALEAGFYTSVDRSDWMVGAEWRLKPFKMSVKLSRSSRSRKQAEGPKPDLDAAASTVARTLSWLCRASLGLQEDTTLFPAERLAVNLFARELAASRTELVEEALAAEDQGHDIASVIRRAGRFPMPIRDSLSIATRLDALSRSESPFADLALELERSLLGGTISTSEGGEMRFAPRDSDVSLPMHMSASVVKSLASLTFYFRHLAHHGAFLIIDEPELNLHPDAQRTVARFLGKVVRRGFKVMISTHSDFIVRELGHLVMLGHAGKKGVALARELGYDPDSLIPPERVGAWLFGGGTAEQIPVDGTGFGVRTIDDEIARLNADSQRIYSELAE